MKGLQNKPEKGPQNPGIVKVLIPGFGIEKIGQNPGIRDRDFPGWTHYSIYCIYSTLNNPKLNDGLLGYYLLYRKITRICPLT